MIWCTVFPATPALAYLYISGCAWSLVLVPEAQRMADLMDGDTGLFEAPVVQVDLLWDSGIAIDLTNVRGTAANRTGSFQIAGKFIWINLGLYVIDSGNIRCFHMGSVHAGCLLDGLPYSMPFRLIFLSEGAFKNGKPACRVPFRRTPCIECAFRWNTCKQGAVYMEPFHTRFLSEGTLHAGCL